MSNEGKPLLRQRLWPKCPQSKLIPLFQQYATFVISYILRHDLTRGRTCAANSSYYYSNPDGSSYYNNGSGGSTYTPPSSGNNSK